MAALSASEIGGDGSVSVPNELEEDDGPDLGPDERDLDLMDGSWEERYYRGQGRRRDWHGIYVGLTLLVLLGMLIPALLVVWR